MDRTHGGRILRIHWPETSSNVELWLQTKQGSIGIEIKRRRWVYWHHVPDIQHYNTGHNMNSTR